MVENSESQHILDIIRLGGWVMIPLLICSVVTLAIILERLVWGPRRSRVIPSELLSELKKLVTSGKLEQVIGICRSNPSTLAQVVLTMMKNQNKERSLIIDAVEAAGKREAIKMQRFVGALGTIGSISPLLGLLGTVSGMIKTFNVIKLMGVGQAQALSGGISEALITTATGLVVAIPALLFYRFFTARAKTLLVELEEISLEIIDDIANLAKHGELSETYSGTRQVR